MKFEVNGHNIFLIVAVCFLSSIVFVQIMKKLAIYMGIVDAPISKRKIQTKAVPLLGGVGIFMSFLLGYMLFAPKNNLMLSVLIASFLLLLVGLFDDLTKKEDIKTIPSKYRLLVHLACASIVVFYGGLELNSINLFGYVINFGVFAPFLTMFIIIAIINAINLIDGLDGLCAGISSIYFLTIAIIGFIVQKYGGLDIILCLTMLGATLGYLVHNFPPASIYQGDAGSTFLGLMIAVVCLIGFKTTTITSLVVPIFVLAIPIMDTLFAIIRRKLKGQRFDQADKEHIHHQFLKKLSKKNSLFAIYGINIMFSITTILFVLKRTKLVVFCYVILLFIVLFLVLKTNIIFERKNEKK